MIESQGYEPGDSWRAYNLGLPSSSYSRGRAAALPPVTADTWREVSQAYTTPATGGPAGMFIPGLLHWLDHLAGTTRFPFNGAWVRAVGRAFGSALIAGLKDDREGPAVCFGVPDIGDALRLSRGRQFPIGWLLFEIGLRRTRRLRVFPAAAPESWQEDRLSALYARIAQAAASAGYRQMDIAPIADDDRSVAAMSALGAQPAQQFTIYEKTL
jgi:hypothetical protein